LYRDTAEQLTCIILDDGVGTLRGISQDFCELLGYRNEEMVHTPASAWFRPGQGENCGGDDQLRDLFARAKDTPGVVHRAATWVPTNRGAGRIGVTVEVQYTADYGGAWIGDAVRLDYLPGFDTTPVRRVPQDQAALAVAQLTALIAQVTDQPYANHGDYLDGMERARRLEDAVRRLEQLEEKVDQALRVRGQAVQLDLGFGLKAVKGRKQPQTKYGRTPEEFTEGLHHSFDWIGEHEDEEPTMENVGLHWWPKPITSGTLRTGLEKHGFVPKEHSGRDCAGVVKRLFQEYHGRMEVAAAFIITTGCNMLHLGLHHYLMRF